MASVREPLNQFIPEQVSNAKSTTVFAGALVLGLLLRLVAAFEGDIDPGGDGMWRLGFAVGWAAHPYWAGLSGVWPPAHWYFLGALIQLWDEPILLARLSSLFFGMGAIFAMRSAVCRLFGELVAAVSALLLAAYWTHIWLTSSYWVELPFIFFVLLAVCFGMRTLRSGSQTDAFFSGLFITFAVLLRHEGHMILGLFILWYVLNLRKPRLVVSFAALPLCVSAWMFIEPWMSGQSFFAFASFVREQKAGENLLQGVTLWECLYQWVLMPSSVPSLFVIIPGFYGLWRARDVARRDLFAWMFIAQVSFYLTMTLTLAWRPQLRYVLLYFVNLLPYTAFAWVGICKRFSARKALASLLLATVCTQAAAWWVGRNNRLPMGWLPLRVLSPPQRAVDDWVSTIHDGWPPGTKIVSMVAGSKTQPWSLAHAYLVNHIPSNIFNSRFTSPVKTEELYVADYPKILSGQLPPTLYTADIILADPESTFYGPVIRALSDNGRALTVKPIHPHIAAVFLTPLSSQKVEQK